MGEGGGEQVKDTERYRFPVSEHVKSWGCNVQHGDMVTLDNTLLHEFFFSFFTGAPVTYGSSQARG